MYSNLEIKKIIYNNATNKILKKVRNINKLMPDIKTNVIHKKKISKV